MTERTNWLAHFGGFTETERPQNIQRTQLAAIRQKRAALCWGKATYYPLDVSGIHEWRPDDWSKLTIMPEKEGPRRSGGKVQGLNRIARG